MSDERLIKILKHEANNHGPEDHKHQAAALLGNIVMELDALRSRHNALVEAVKWERVCEDVAHWRYEVWEMAEVGSGDCEIYTVAQCIRDDARAEVDRLLSEESK